AALTVTMPKGMIQAKPGSDVLLPFYFEESSGHIDPKCMAVIWLVGTIIIAKYEDKLEIFHKGAKMSPEDLLWGNASLLLPNVQDADGNTYTCVVIHSPDHEKQSVELRVEAPPLVKLGSTNVQLTKPSTVACTATDFYPGKISMTWFRNDRIVQGPKQPPAQPSNGQLFRAESVLKLIPEFSDANANFSCHIHHQAHEGPESVSEPSVAAAAGAVAPGTSALPLEPAKDTDRQLRLRLCVLNRAGLRGHPALPAVEKKNSVTETSNEKKPLQKTDEEKVLDSSNPKTGETSSGLIPTEEFNDVQEQ
ncbi:IGLC2: Ig lambda-2 chain C region, partial [Crotalus adamanteus]